MGRGQKPTTAGIRRRVVKRAAAMRRRRWKEGHREVVERKVRRLQRIIPGGQGLQPDRLFLLTADYILHLRLQLNFLHALSKFYSSNF